MPYIKQEDRKKYEDDLKELLNIYTFQALNRIFCMDKNYPRGVANYLATSVCHYYLKKNGLNYSNIDTIINNLKTVSKSVPIEYVGTIECVIQELYRTVVGPYEDLKIKDNGDIDILD